MTAVKIAELKDRLSEYLRAVERGGEVTVTDRSRPIARIVPVEIERPRLTVTPPRLPFASIRARKWPPARWDVRSGTLLAEERNER